MQSQTELERMFMMSVDMLGIADFDGILQKLNPAWERVLGYSLDELIGRHFIDFVHPDDKQATLNEARRNIQSQSMNTFENRYLCKDGRIKWISWHYISYPEAQQTYFVARDITAQRQHRERLQEAKEQLQAILDNSGMVVGLKDMDGRYILTNTEFALRFGDGSRESVVGKTDFDLFPAAVARRLRANDVDVLRARDAMQFEEQIPIDGELYVYLTTKFTLNDADGNPYAVCTIAKDITQRKLTEMQLLLRNQAIEHSPSGISIADARLPDLPLIYINPAFEHIMGYTKFEAIGRNCRFLQGDDRDQPQVRQIRDALKKQESVTVVLRNYRKDGSLFYNELSLAPIYDESGELTHYVGITTDVTERVEAQEHIHKQNEALMQVNRNLAQARREAEEATRLKSQFLATMSHELRTPLNAIIGYTEIQLAGMTGTLTNEQQDYQGRILVNAEHLLDLINDVLDIAKIEAGRLEILHKPFHLMQWVAEVEAQMRVLAEEKALQFYISVDERMPAWIEGDPARLRQVAINLLSNAIKFTHVGDVRLQIRKHGRDAWKLIVQDTGEGIPSHMQETIFEAFRQVDSSSQRKTGGTGLGLPLVRKLALMMAGNVRVKSQLGTGSTFTVILPLVEVQETKP